MTMLYLAALTAALTVGLVVFGFFAVMPAHSRAVRARMLELGLQGNADQDAARRRRRESRIGVILQSLGEKISPAKRDLGPLRARLVHAGYREPLAVPVYVGIRSVAAAGLFVFASGVVALSGTVGPMVLFAGIWGAFVGMFVPSFMLSVRISRRQREIQKALPDALDLLVICVEAGLGLNQALIRVAAEMRHVNQLITDEIAQSNLEIRAGTPRDRALVAMADRTGVADVRSLVTMLIQTERFGTSIARSLRVHSDSMRVKRRQRAEEAAAKTTIKMVFPLALCIFPALIVVILGPALIQIVQTLSSM
jgi:tight adherence protein C